MFVSIAAQDYPTITELMLPLATRARLRQLVPLRSNRLAATLAFQHSWSISHGDLQCGLLAAPHVNVKMGARCKTDCVRGNLDNTVDYADCIRDNLDNTINQADCVRGNLDHTVNHADCVKGNLDNTINHADCVRGNLGNTVNHALVQLTADVRAVSTRRPQHF